MENDSHDGKNQDQLEDLNDPDHEEKKDEKNLKIVINIRSNKAPSISSNGSQNSRVDFVRDVSTRSVDEGVDNGDGNDDEFVEDNCEQSDDEEDEDEDEDDVDGEQDDEEVIEDEEDKCQRDINDNNGNEWKIPADKNECTIEEIRRGQMINKAAENACPVLGCERKINENYLYTAPALISSGLRKHILFVHYATKKKHSKRRKHLSWSSRRRSSSAPKKTIQSTPSITSNPSQSTTHYTNSVNDSDARETLETNIFQASSECSDIGYRDNHQNIPSKSNQDTPINIKRETIDRSESDNTNIGDKSSPQCTLAQDADSKNHKTADFDHDANQGQGQNVKHTESIHVSEDAHDRKLGLLNSSGNEHADMNIKSAGQDQGQVDDCVKSQQDHQQNLRKIVTSQFNLRKLVSGVPASCSSLANLQQHAPDASSATLPVSLQQHTQRAAPTTVLSAFTGLGSGSGELDVDFDVGMQKDVNAPSGPGERFTSQNQAQNQLRNDNNLQNQGHGLVDQGYMFQGHNQLKRPRRMIESPNSQNLLTFNPLISNSNLNSGFVSNNRPVNSSRHNTSHFGQQDTINSGHNQQLLESTLSRSGKRPHSSTTVGGGINNSKMNNESSLSAGSLYSALSNLMQQSGNILQNSTTPSSSSRHKQSNNNSALVQQLNVNTAAAQSSRHSGNLSENFAPTLKATLLDQTRGGASGSTSGNPSQINLRRTERTDDGTSNNQPELHNNVLHSPNSSATLDLGPPLKLLLQMCCQKLNANVSPLALEEARKFVEKFIISLIGSSQTIADHYVSGSGASGSSAPSADHLTVKPEVDPSDVVLAYKILQKSHSPA